MRDVRVPRICFLNQELLIMGLTVEEPPSFQLKKIAERAPQIPNSKFVIPNCIKPKVLCGRCAFRGFVF